jgi:hypothetical protein
MSIQRHQRSVARAFAFALAFSAVTAAARADETIVFLRHGEKPSSGLGQLTCQGLNRALALPDVLIGSYGTPTYVYAPNPTVKVNDPSGSYFYVRPLATIEPTAIRAAVSVNTSYGYTDVSGLRSILIKSSKANAKIFVAWEHEYLVKVVQSIMNAYGGGAPVPAWVTGDYDSLYVVRVKYGTDGSIKATFQIQHEGLNNRSTTCP